MTTPGSSTRTAFRAGYDPQVAGLYFNGLVLVAEAERFAEEAVAAQVENEGVRVAGRRETALARLTQTEAHLASLGARLVARPEDVGGYMAWTDAVFDAVRDAMASDSPEAVAHLLGWVLGEAEATLDVLAIVSRLREMDPDHLWMRLQADSLERERQTAERRLGRLAAHPLFPEAVQVATALAAHAVSEGAPTGSHAGRATRAQAAAASVAARALAIEASL